MSFANPPARAAFVAALAASLSIGCQTTTDPSTGERKTTSTTDPATVIRRLGARPGAAPSGVPHSVQNLAPAGARVPQ